MKFARPSHEAAELSISSADYAYSPQGPLFRQQAKHELYAKTKRLLDILIVIACAPAVLVVTLLAAGAILILEGRPVFFVHNRVGRGGRVFPMLKLRTMRPNADANRIATLKNDPRITPLGKLLRGSHIDELPQLWNILLGDMTLIGPRPEQPALVEFYRERLPNYDLRHMVTPGLSGLAQVGCGYAADLSETAKKLAYDLEYLELYGPKVDLLIVLKTFRAFFDPRLTR
jgi:lipopolysaccharide/colanic/teichoic acid biosynthesis glycosyltransferase